MQVLSNLSKRDLFTFKIGVSDSQETVRTLVVRLNWLQPAALRSCLTVACDTLVPLVPFPKRRLYSNSAQHNAMAGVTGGRAGRARPKIVRPGRPAGK